MSGAMNARDRLTTTGVWFFTESMSAGEGAGFAGRENDLGYSTLWLPEIDRRDARFVDAVDGPGVVDWRVLEALAPNA